MTDPHEARLDKYGWTVNRDNVRAIIEQIADYPEIVAAANLLAQPTADEAEPTILRGQTIHPCARCGDRLVVGYPGGMDVCGTCGGQVADEVRAEKGGDEAEGDEREARVLAVTLCNLDRSWEHHDQTDDHPCSRCVRVADRVVRLGYRRAALAADTPTPAPEGSGRAS